MVIEGEPGIGKTTLWLEAIEQARQAGFYVLTTRPASAESTVAYASLADLLSTVGPSLWAHLPAPQRRAIDKVLLRSDDDGPATEPRTVAAAFLSVVESLASKTPVLVAIDDVQWLDSSSTFALGFAVRRISGAVGVLGTVRTEPQSVGATSWLQLADPDGVRRITLPPFSIGELSELLPHRLRRPFSRPVVTRIHQISDGNPFYALELARVADDSGSHTEASFPSSLTDLVNSRIGDLDEDVREVLLVTACQSAPTIDTVARATGSSAQRVVELLEVAETQGIIVIDGSRLRFSHPLLAAGVYAGSTPPSRRAAHRRLAEVVDQPELKARHLALSATTTDPATLDALDAAAELARGRGAPAAAAELLDLAERFDGHRPERQIRCANYHFEAGNPVRARTLLESTVGRLEPGPLRARAANLLATIVMYADGFGSSAGLLERFLPEAAEDPALLIQMLMALAYTLMNIGRKRESVKRIDEAVDHAERLGQPTLLSRALGLRVVLRFMCGAGVDDGSLQRALALDDDRSPAPVAFQPAVQRAILMAWTGALDTAREDLRAIQRRRIENGEESEWIFISYHRAMVEIWSGDFPAADGIADDMMDRAGHLDGDVALFSAMAIWSALAAYGGRVEEARRDAQVALDASNRGEGRELAGWMIANLGFLEVSLGNYEAALTVLQPVVDGLFEDPDYSEIIVASSVTDAVEAMIHLNRLDQGDKLIDLMERNGRRLDRPWMLVVALRGRSMLLAARGDVESASLVAEQAMAEHDRLPMPFERARTQLLLGQIQRRQRQKESASATLQEALHTFESLNTPLWADRARAELARVKVGRSQGQLTPSEQRVAELAATGMTKGAIATALFISPKTVDTNLTRIYRKLGVHSRAELARRMSELGGGSAVDDM